MKDGRPSRIVDIRYFSSDRHSYLKGHEDAVAFGRRLAWYLNGEDFSLGAYHSLYVFFDPALEPGAVRVTGEGGDWWQRYTHVGVPKSFPDSPDASEQIMAGTVAALKKIRPDLAAELDRAAQLVRAQGADLRFLLKTKRNRQFTVEVAFSIAGWPSPSHLHVSLIDRKTGAFLDAPPIPLAFYAEAFDLAGEVKIAEAAAQLSANKGVGATLTAALHGGPLVKELSEFQPAPRPLQSKLVRPRG